MTTLARLGLILEGEIAPCNWIEEAFARIVAAIGSVLPTVSDSDRGKFLGVNSNNNNLSWKDVRQVPEVENADKGKYLHANEDTGALEWSEAGGGSGLPNYTSTDKDKVLAVKENITNASVVDEQNVAFDSSGVGALAANSYRVPTGMSGNDETCYIEMTYDGNTNKLIGASWLDGDDVCVSFQAGISIINVWLTGTNAGKITMPYTDITLGIKVYMPVATETVAPVWSKQGTYFEVPMYKDEFDNWYFSAGMDFTKLVEAWNNNQIPIAANGTSGFIFTGSAVARADSYFYCYRPSGSGISVLEISASGITETSNGGGGGGLD